MKKLVESDTLLTRNKLKSIKNYFVLLTLSIFFIGNQAQAQKPEPVYSIVKQLQPYEWYVKQAGLWKKEIQKDSTNAPAWYNYYIANRMANLTGKPDKWDSEKDKVLQDMAAIVEDMGKAIPESFEYNHVVFWNGGNNIELFPYLEKAYAIDPNRPETYDDFITYYEVKRDKAKVEQFCKMWYNSGDVSPGILNMNYNVMMSIEEDAIIFTAGDNDTYPLWILQYAKNINKNVVVLNTSLIFIEEYRKALFSELNIPAFEKEVSDFVTKEIKKKDNYQLAYNEFQKALVKHIVDNSRKRPVYFAATVRKNIYADFEDKLYLEGLAFKYSEAGYDNLAILRRNVEKRFLLDYLQIDFANDMSLSVVDHTNFNYILPFVNLYDHYVLASESEKATWIKSLAMKVAKRAGQEEKIKTQFARSLP